jgi:hypothetical protein
MIRFAALLLLGTCLGAQAQEREIQRALIERDQQSAAFAAGARGAPAPDLSALNARQLSDVMAIPLPPELRPYQRFRMAEERALVLPPPKEIGDSYRSPLPLPFGRSVAVPDLDPLPLPGGPRGGVDPVLPQGLPY